MKKSSLILALSMCFASSAFAANLNVAYRQQQHDYWCWAATSEMLLEFVNKRDYVQCALVNQSLGLNYACNPNAPFEWRDPVNEGEYTDRVAALLTKNGVRSSYYSRALSVSALRTKIDNGKPVIVVVQYGDGAQHAMLIRGYDRAVSNPVLAIHDPWPAEDGGGSFLSYYNTFKSNSTYYWLETVAPN